MQRLSPSVHDPLLANAPRCIMEMRTIAKAKLEIKKLITQALAFGPFPKIAKNVKWILVEPR
jgi:hypothetical protein